MVPHSAYSAATMLALSGNGIVLHPSATLGPIDPQVGVPTKEGMIRFVPAKSILNGFAKAKKFIKDEGPETLPAYIPLIEKYSLDLFELCEDSEKLSKELVSSWLKKYMFAGVKNNGRKIKKAASYFSDYNTHKVHSRPLTPDKLSDFGLKLEVAENPLRDLLWEAYILLNGFFNVSPFVKLYECTHGVSWGKQFQIIMGPPQTQLQSRPQSQPKPQQKRRASFTGTKFGGGGKRGRAKIPSPRPPSFLPARVFSLAREARRQFCSKKVRISSNKRTFNFNGVLDSNQPGRPRHHRWLGSL